MFSGDRRDAAGGGLAAGVGGCAGHAQRGDDGTDGAARDARK